MNIGAYCKGPKECEFAVWAPFRNKVDLRIIGSKERIYPMQKDDRGYWKAVVDAVGPLTQYSYILDDDLTRPDPASFFQPKDVHSPSQIVDHDSFIWKDKDWINIPLPEMIIYEIHTGTFTQEGTFKAVIPRLKELSDLGVNAIELMPVAQFPGERNWGYDGVYLFAAQNSYGGPEGLKELVNACHLNGIAVLLDVVYNHIGPEGNYLNDFGPYFTDKYQTPWGKAINFDDQYNDEVRNYFVQNALYWFEYFHIDGLRLDAVHAIMDGSAKPFLKELGEKTAEWSGKNKKDVYLIAESDLNDIKVIQPPALGGFGLQAQWSDDFHHAMHALLTKEKGGYYQDFGTLHQLKKAFEESFAYSWDYSPYRNRRHGSSAKEIPAEKFVVFLQNHDQTGNRMLGERLSKLVSTDKLKISAGLLFFSPYIPLVFMGEEYAEEAPFYYFVSHSDKGLIEAVRKGRAAEFSSFNWKDEPLDPQGEKTFLDSKINWSVRHSGQHGIMLGYWQELIRLRKSKAALKNLERKNLEVVCFEGQNVFVTRRWSGNNQVVVLVNFSQETQTVTLNLQQGAWIKIIDSLDIKWNGSGAILDDRKELNNTFKLGPLSFAAYERELINE